jgi:hypothetical protein
MIDESQDELSTVAHLIESLGFEVATSFGPSSAYGFCRSHYESLDAIIMEINITSFCSFRLALDLKCEFPHIPILAFDGGFRRKFVKDDYDDRPFDAVIAKPYRKELIIKHLERICETKNPLDILVEEVWADHFKSNLMRSEERFYPKDNIPVILVHDMMNWTTVGEMIDMSLHGMCIKIEDESLPETRLHLYDMIYQLPNYPNEVCTAKGLLRHQSAKGLGLEFGYFEADSAKICYEFLMKTNDQSNNVA